VAPGAEVLAASNQGALAVREGKHVRLGFEPSRSDWPQRVDYAHFIANVLAWSMPGSQGVVQRGVHRTELADAGGHPGEQPRPWLPTAALLAALLLLFEAVWSSSIHGRHP
jgi:hypothetical protein